MFHWSNKRRVFLLYHVISCVLIASFSVTTILPPSYAQSIGTLNLPVPGTIIGLSQPYVPVLLKGMTIHPEDPLRFDFIIDSGNTDFTQDEIRKESERLVKYFLASMTVPKDDLWVNLSPYEAGRIIPEELGKTELGRDMLAQDYILKQLTASLMYPEEELGKKFWDKIYKLAQDKFGTSEISMNTFNKVWIMPESATVYENNQTVYVVESRLKVLLEEDYLALDKNKENNDIGIDQLSNDQYKDSTSLSSQIVREIILPEIEREVNEGENFALLRQIYHSLILSKWYKETIKESLLSKVYVDQKKMIGIELDDKTLKNQIYGRYMEAYKKGVFDFIKEDYDPLSQKMIPRKYFLGGEEFDDIHLKKTKEFVDYDVAMVGDVSVLGIELKVISNKTMHNDKAQLSKSERLAKINAIGNTDRIHDVLARQLPLDEEGIAAMFQQKTVLVTGAGNVGTALIRRLLDYPVTKIVVLEHSEPRLNEIRELLSILDTKGVEISFVLADLRDAKRVDRVFDKEKPNIVFHTAAYRLVPRVEENPQEGFKVNVIGTKNLLQAAENYDVERFVLFSSGKAADPFQSSSYGLTKELAEYTLRAFSSNPQSKTKHSIVRLTHVIEGSLVINYFKKQIENGTAVTVTHEDMLPGKVEPNYPSKNGALLQNVNEAIGLAFTAALSGDNGEIFGLKNYGRGTSIELMAIELFEEAGKEPDIRYIPLREGDVLRAGEVPAFPMFKSDGPDREQVVGKIKEVSKYIVNTNSSVVVGKTILAVLRNLNEGIDDLDNNATYQAMEKLIDRIKKGVYQETFVNPLESVQERSLQFPLDGLESKIKGRKVLITGGGGNIAEGLALKILQLAPSEIILVDNNENVLKATKQTLSLRAAAQGLDVKIIGHLANLQQESQVTRIFGMHRPEIIIHTASHKLQPVIQENPTEAVINNIMSTYNLVVSARQSRELRQFVYVSTDKTARPTAIYDLTKKVAELIVQGNFSGIQIDYGIVRFGNVFERSPVIDLFTEQVENGVKLSVTSPEAKRYFMKREEAVNLILSAVNLEGKGNVFVADMERLIPIIDIAKAIIWSHGKEPVEGVNYEFVGNRPGEKFEEELFSKEEEVAGLKRMKDVLVGNVEFKRVPQATINPLVLGNVKILKGNHLSVEGITDMLVNIIRSVEPGFTVDYGVQPSSAMVSADVDQWAAVDQKAQELMGDPDKIHEVLERNNMMLDQQGDYSVYGVVSFLDHNQTLVEYFKQIQMEIVIAIDDTEKLKNPERLRTSKATYIDPNLLHLSYIGHALPPGDASWTNLRENAIGIVRDEVQKLTQSEVTAVGPHLTEGLGVILQYSPLNKQYHQFMDNLRFRLSGMTDNQDIYRLNIAYSSVAYIREATPVQVRKVERRMHELRTQGTNIRSNINGVWLNRNFWNRQMSERGQGIYLKSDRAFDSTIDGVEGSVAGDDKALLTDVGGVDLNEINLRRQGSGINVQFDPAEFQEIINISIDGLVPVIINLTPVNSIMPILGLEPMLKEEEHEISSLN